MQTVATGALHITGVMQIIVTTAVQSPSEMQKNATTTVQCNANQTETSRHAGTANGKQILQRTPRKRDLFLQREAIPQHDAKKATTTVQRNANSIAFTLRFGCERDRRRSKDAGRTSSNESRTKPRERRRRLHWCVLHQDDSIGASCMLQRDLFNTS